MNRLKTILRSPLFAALVSGLLAWFAVQFWLNVIQSTGRDIPATIAALAGFFATNGLLIFGGPRLHFRLVHGRWPPTAREMKAARRELDAAIEELQRLVLLHAEQLREQHEQEPWVRDPDWWKERRN